MQALHLPQISIDRQFDRDRLDQTIEYYETIIDRGDESHLNYWYLGIAYLLQEREVDAQATWFIPFDSDAAELSDLTSDLADILDRVASEKLALDCLDDAWLISQYLREVDAARIDNLFRSILLEIKLERFTPETLSDLDAANVLKNTEDRQIDRQLVAKLLTSILYYPSVAVCEFIGQCLVYLIQDRAESILIVLDAVLALEHRIGSHTFFIEVLEQCLSLHPDNIAILNALSRLHCNARDYKQAIQCATHAYTRCEHLIGKVITNNTILRAILSSGDWLNADEIIDRHYRLLSEFVDRDDEALPPNTNQLLIVAAVFIACLNDRPEYFRSLQNRIAKKYLKSVRYRSPDRSIVPASVTKPSGVIRIGYLASTLRRHSVGWSLTIVSTKTLTIYFIKNGSSNVQM
jgi:predicted O-linked N-acetylglucosamine transferase (SPINDLY family)